MPFPQGNSFAFTPVSVKKNAPASPGIYGIFNGSQWIYVGVGEDIQQTLLAHLHDTENCIRRFNPTGFSFELDTEANRRSRQEILIRELGTQCNHQNGNLPQLPWLKAL
jgi:hypothetical protein